MRIISLWQSGNKEVWLEPIRQLELKGFWYERDSCGVRLGLGFAVLHLSSCFVIIE